MVVARWHSLIRFPIVRLLSRFRIGLFFGLVEFGGQALLQLLGVYLWAIGCLWWSHHWHRFIVQLEAIVLALGVGGVMLLARRWRWPRRVLLAATMVLSGPSAGVSLRHLSLESIRFVLPDVEGQKLAALLVGRDALGDLLRIIRVRERHSSLSHAALILEAAIWQDRIHFLRVRLRRHAADRKAFLHLLS